MEVFRDVAEVARLVWPVIATLLTLIGLGLLFMARRVLVFREDLYDKDGKRLYCLRGDLRDEDGKERYARVRDLNDWGGRVNKIEKATSATQQRSQANERQIEILQERDRQMLDRFASELVQPLREITRDLKEHGKMIADIRERIGRIEGERKRGS